eukprot:CAMPEP_0170121958 /NCGR_PEP_ID=MMETSP0020_2-20130122/16298_1 /TAXON_ID=98059 /ORGANISM="Dinobryon sp., Strain UTEXLB2267" /LENGTH=693 /DNA_ID=CAMNT_0010352613 /DNA_START=298 /DNA_END=2379 /DNA_ORIENTATION=+
MNKLEEARRQLGPFNFENLPLDRHDSLWAELLSPPYSLELEELSALIKARCSQPGAGLSISAQEALFLNQNLLQQRQQKLEEQYQKLRIEQKKRTSFISDTYSRAETIHFLEENGLLSSSKRFDENLEDVSVDWWPQGADVNFPDEKIPVNHRKKIKQVKVISIPDPSAFSKVTVGIKSPDVVFYDGLDKRGSSAITMIGEVKGGGSGDFSASEKGQLVDVTQRLMKQQPFRQSMIVFLTDGRRFEYFRCLRREANNFRFHHSAIFLRDVGWRILFGLLQADPAETLGYERIDVPGFVIGDFLGSGSFSDVVKATVNDEKVIFDAPEQEEEVVLPANLVQHRVDGDGNCLFHAVAHQLQVAGVLDSHGDVYTHEMLRVLTVSRVEVDARFRLMMSDLEYFDLSRLTGYVDHGAIAALAATLGVDIVIYGAPGGQPVHIVSGSASDHHISLRIVYNGINHYDSVVESAFGSEGSSSVAARRRRLKSGQQWRLSGTNLPLAIKFFRKKHRHMRDHEWDILRSLRINTNVPFPIRCLEVLNRPAIIVSPAGKKVFPVGNEAVANKTDLVKLLQALISAHGLGICHRDVKPQNIFKDELSRIILNDWSSAATTGVRVPWVGTEPFYDQQEVDEVGTHQPRPEDDLVALVRSGYMMLCSYLQCNRLDNVMNCSQNWRAALKAARDCDYDELRNIFNIL